MRETLGPLYEKGLLNSVLLSVGEIEEPEELEEWGLHREDPKIRLEYNINGHGAPLQFDLWKHLGEITGGIRTDPQSGKKIRVRRAKGKK